MKKERLGEVLRERGQISRSDLSKAIEDQQGKLIHLGELILERGHCIPGVGAGAEFIEISREAVQAIEEEIGLGNEAVQENIRVPESGR
jgi:hypothetical protein